jgi:hypothetical protein
MKGVCWASHLCLLLILPPFCPLWAWVMSVACGAEAETLFWASPCHMLQGSKNGGCKATVRGQSCSPSQPRLGVGWGGDFTCGRRAKHLWVVLIHTGDFCYLDPTRSFIICCWPLLVIISCVYVSRKNAWLLVNHLKKVFSSEDTCEVTGSKT